MLTAILLIGDSLIARAGVRVDKLFQGIPINSNTCQVRGKRSAAGVVHATANTVSFFISSFHWFFVTFLSFFYPVRVIYPYPTEKNVARAGTGQQAQRLVLVGSRGLTIIIGFYDSMNIDYEVIWNQPLIVRYRNVRWKGCRQKVRISGSFKLRIRYCNSFDHSSVHENIEPFLNIGEDCHLAIPFDCFAIHSPLDRKSISTRANN